MMKTILKNKNGITLILSIMLMTLVLFLSLYYLNFSLSEKQISSSQSIGAKTYYLAESGVADMIWKLKNDATYKTNFETDPNWVASTTRVNPFGADSGSYTVTITNSSQAHADIVSTGSVTINGKTSQRIIKTKVFKAMGESLVGPNAIYADGNIDISSSIVNYLDGGSHSNGVYIVNGASVLTVEGDLNATGNYLLNWQATTSISGEIHAANYPPAAAPVIMPAVDFNSAATSSMKNRATTTYTAAQFEALLNDNPNLTLDGPIIYVNGEVEIEKAINLTINGLLVIQGDLEIDSNNTKTINITINHATGTPAGIMSSEKIEIKKLKGTIDINGVIYANDTIDLLNITSAAANFDIIGGLIARKVTITSCTRPINIHYNTDPLNDSFFAAQFSPVVTVEHWEEEY